MKQILLLLFFLMLGFYCLAQQKAKLTVRAPVLSPVDTLELYVWQDIVSLPGKNPSRLFIAANTGGVFHFEVDSLSGSSWISLNLSFQKFDGRPIYNILDTYPLQEGDDVTVHLSPRMGRIRSVGSGYDGTIPVINENWEARFEGQGSVKFSALWDAAAIDRTESQHKVLATIDEEGSYKNLVLQYILLRDALAVFEGYRGGVSPDVYAVLEGQIRGKYGERVGKILEGFRQTSKNEEEKTRLQTELDRYLGLSDTDRRENDLFAGSPHYIEYLVKYYWLAFTEQSAGRGGVADWYSYCKEAMPASRLRDRVLTSLLTKRFQDRPQMEILEDAFRTIRDPYCLARLELLKRHVAGRDSYAFSLPDAQGNYYSLDDFRGKVVFMDFWYAGCIPCRHYMIDVVAPIKHRFKDNPDVVFITVSTDALDTFQKMMEREDFLPKGGIHLYTDNKRYDHPIIKYYQINAYPFPLLLDREGRLTEGANRLRSTENLTQAIERALQK